MRLFLRPINLLLIAGPIGVANEIFELGGGKGLTFLLIALALIPLAGLIAGFTDVIAERAGDRIGGLLEATFGNAAFIILGVLALSQGLTDVVEASIAGAIISNTLFVLGGAFFFGALSGKQQLFNKDAAQNYAKLLALALVALVLPAIAEASTSRQGDVVGSEVSATSAIILILLYVAYLVFDLFHVRDFAYQQAAGGAPTRKKRRQRKPDVNAETAPIAEYRAEEGIAPAPAPRLTALAARRARASELHLNPLVAAIGLAAVLVATVYLSETLVEITRTITQDGEPITLGSVSLGTLRLTGSFVGLVVIPLIGTAAEHLSALRSAVAGRTEITITVTAGAAIQVALLATPVFVLASFFVSPHPFTLIFKPIELAVFAMATFLFYLVTEDGEGTWLEGALLLAFYLIFAGTAYFLP
jgi:Ca2+:H+ antiporter